MARNIKGRKAKVNRDFLIIVLLVVIIFSLTIYILFSKLDSKDDITRKNFLSTMQNAQSKLSYYMCEMEKDTFGLYTQNEILAGKSNKTSEEDSKKNTNEEDKNIDNSIKDIEGNALTGIIYTDKNYGTDDNPIYKVNITDLQKVLNITIESFDGIEFYIENGITLKVGFEFSKPSWWNDNFDVFVIK